MKTELQNLFKTVNVNSSDDLNLSALSKLNKNSLANLVTGFVSLMEENVNLCKSAAAKIDELKSEQILNQKKLLDVQEKQINGVQTVIKTEMKSWADVVKKNSKQSTQITPNTVKQAVRTVNDEEKRSRNVMIYGLEEKEDESPEDHGSQIRSIYENIGECSPPDTVDHCYRVGNDHPGKKRPLKVLMQREVDAQFLLQNAYRLRDSELSSVYIGPDRSKEERIAHRKLVTEMKTMIENDSSKYYYIRGNKIRSVDKALSSDSGA